MSKRYRPIKLEDLAKKLKVSKVTISKALRDHPDISSATTAKVKELAEKLGYMPNVMAKNLSARKSNTIGLVIPKIAHVFFASVIDSIYNTAFENNYEIVLTVSQEKADRERKQILSLLSMRVDGLIVSVTQETKDIEIFQRASKSGIPLVFIDRIPDLPEVSSVTVDNEGGAFSAVEYAVHKGLTKIAHIGGLQNINIGRKRYEGFIRAMNTFKIPLNPDWFIEGGFDEIDGYIGFNKIFSNGILPEYIFAATYPIAMGVYSAAAEHGIKIPEDIEVTCFGKSNFNTFSSSVFNFVDQPTQELGNNAVSLMVEKICNPGLPPKNIVLKTELIVRSPNAGRDIVG